MQELQKQCLPELVILSATARSIVCQRKVRGRCIPKKALESISFLICIMMSFLLQMMTRMPTVVGSSHNDLDKVHRRIIERCNGSLQDEWEEGTR